MSLAVANFERVLCVEFAEFAAVVKIAAEFGARHGGVGEVALAVELFMAEDQPARPRSAGAASLRRYGIDGAEDGARHLHE